MNKKNIFLLVVVIVVWMFVIYKIINPYRDSYISNVNTNGYPDKRIKFNAKDTFVLKTIKRDPFLRNTVSSNNNQVYIKKKEALSPPVVKSPPLLNKEVVFPNMEYYGYIKSVNNNEQLVLMKLEHKIFKLKTGQSELGVTVLKTSNDSVLVSYKGVKKSIKKFK